MGRTAFDKELCLAESVGIVKLLRREEMSNKHANNDPQKNTGGCPGINQDNPKNLRQNAKDHWKDVTETMNEAPAASPNAEEQSRKS